MKGPKILSTLARLLPGLALVLLAACAGAQPRYHRVSDGETLIKIATRYEVPVSSLVKQNREVIGRRLTSGTKLYIPFEDNPQWNSGEVDREIERGNTDKRTVPNDGLQANFSWPVMGGVSSAFGPRKGRDHEGVDIVAPKGTPVRASRSGHVLYSNNAISGYGNMIIIKHADTYATVYAHLSKFNVRKGQFVSRGSIIGRVGATGRATSPHLHFEIRNRRRPENPLHFLRGQYASR